MSKSQYKIVVDGNDGTGKTTLIEALTKHGYECQDRGLPTKMTDDENLLPTENNVIYLILDASVETSHARLKLAGRDLNEKYHTRADLMHYRERFLAVAKKLPNAQIIKADGDAAEVLQTCLSFLQSRENC